MGFAWEKKHAVFVPCSVSLAIKKTKEELHQSINTFSKQLAHFPSLIAVTIPLVLGLCSLYILLALFFFPKTGASIIALWRGPQKPIDSSISFHTHPRWQTQKNISKLNVWVYVPILSQDQGELFWINGMVFLFIYTYTHLCLICMHSFNLSGYYNTTWELLYSKDRYKRSILDYNSAVISLKTLTTITISSECSIPL